MRRIPLPLPRAALWALIVAAPAAAVAAPDAPIDAYRRAHEVQILGELDALVRLRSVAADPQGLSDTAAHLLAALRQRGFEAQSVSAAPGTPPLLLGTLSSRGARRTVVFYAHYDGQPVTPSQWRSPPFVPVMRGAPPGEPEQEIDWRKATPPFDPQWRLYGRAVSDDKASIVALLTALDALRAVGRRPTVNVKVVWDGEEEAGSPHLAELLRAHARQLRADLWLVGDGPVHASRRPLLYFGARGVLGLELTVYGPLQALHDGHYGNWAPNPAALAANLLAQMRDDTGRILIPGFDAEIRPLSAAERAALAALPPVDAELQRQLGIGRPESAEDLPDSLMRPALNVRGIRAGEVGAAAANSIPTEARVSLDLRLVPAQTPQRVREVVEQFLRAQGWTLLSEAPDEAARRAHPRLIKLAWEPGYPALRSDMDSPPARAVIATLGAVAREPVALLPMIGGSVPLYLFADLFAVPVIGLPIVNHDNAQHAANENLRLRNLWDGIDAYAALIGRLDW